MVGSRPGAPALVAALAGALRLNVSAVTAGLASALGVAVGAASAALVRRRRRRGEDVAARRAPRGHLLRSSRRRLSGQSRGRRRVPRGRGMPGRTPPVVVGCGRAPGGRWSGACAVPGPRDRRVRGSRRARLASGRPRRGARHRSCRHIGWPRRGCGPPRHRSRVPARSPPRRRGTDTSDGRDSTDGSSTRTASVSGYGPPVTSSASRSRSPLPGPRSPMRLWRAGSSGGSSRRGSRRSRSVFRSATSPDGFPDRLVTFGFAVPIGAAIGLGWPVAGSAAEAGGGGRSSAGSPGG